MLEISSQEVDEYYSPKDLQLGQRVKLLSRCFLLYDCDAFTKEYYEKNHPEIEMKTIKLPKKIDKRLDRKKVKYEKKTKKKTNHNQSVNDAVFID